MLKKHNTVEDLMKMQETYYRTKFIKQTKELSNDFTDQITKQSFDFMQNHVKIMLTRIKYKNDLINVNNSAKKLENILLVFYFIQ